MAETPQGDAAMNKIASGAVSKMSVGYVIDDETESRAPDGTLTVTVTRWTPYEASLVSVPADPNANIRGLNMKCPRRLTSAAPQIDIDQVDDIDQIDDTDVIDDEPPARQVRQAAQRSANTQRAIDGIFRRAVLAGIDARALDTDLHGVETVTEARDLVMNQLARMSSATATSPNRGDGRHDQRTEEAEAHMVEALSIRLGGSQTIQGQNEFRGLSATGIGRAHMEMVGISTRGMNDVEIARRMSMGGYGQRSLHTTSDFPMLMNTAVNDALMARFGAQLTPLKQYSTERSARDFKPMSYIRPGEAPLLDKVLESGEVTSGTLSEEKQGLQIETFAKRFGLTRQAYYNDSLGGLADFTSAFAISAATREGQEFYGLISANGFGGKKLSDGKNLFHADHGNLGSAASLTTLAGLSAGRQAMRQQMNVNGSWVSGAVPTVLLVGPAQETNAQMIVAEINSTTITDVNPFGGKIKVEVENRYDGDGWWLLADPASRPAFMHAYLDGVNGPQVETRDGWEVLGTEFRCILDFGCSVYDYRAIYFNPGQ
ncbi:HK97 family phage prohead protease [Mesorhizobium sp. B2-3-5]|uniref:phage major capsid protein n=1 Tax=Mesorhizobium sp. B2-3-5 TaxID=2589958 RepID=UPI0015E2E895|nr:HK97 family phage prohead protease [Mesorhizobium sp. B2-3-5]